MPSESDHEQPLGAGAGGVRRAVTPRRGVRRAGAAAAAVAPRPPNTGASQRSKRLAPPRKCGQPIQPPTTDSAARITSGTVIVGGRLVDVVPHLVADARFSPKKVSDTSRIM